MSFFNTPTDKNLALSLDVLPAVLLVLAASGLCGRLAVALKQPRVLGEMVAGVLLGPTVLSLGRRARRPCSRPTSSRSSTVEHGGSHALHVPRGVGLQPQGRRRAEGRQSRRPGPVGHRRAAGPRGGRGRGAARRDVAVRRGHGRVLPLPGRALSITAFPMLARILYERNPQNSRLGRLSSWAPPWTTPPPGASWRS
ncbi:hypothetical protein LT493_43895 [Streptomyces tricolor]|nr:hypothetical protein [Streptomyces tricolor]